jgi:hypothetical protein
MGRIRTTRKEERMVVVIEGRLTASDMGRLEHACSPELVSSTPHLQIDVSRVKYTDATAAALLRRMAERGALLITAPWNRTDRNQRSAAGRTPEWHRHRRNVSTG